MKPHKRTIFVLVSLVVAMTMAGGVLLAVEPGPVMPFRGIALQAIDSSAHGQKQDSLFNTASSRSWKAIVIRDSNTYQDSAHSLALKNGSDGLGYDFVVNNGSLRADGLIEIGHRWRQQVPGAYLTGKNADWFNSHAVGICMVGNGDKKGFSKEQLKSLVWLVRKLQKQYHISKSAVLVSVGKNAKLPAKSFPHVWFRKQLLTVSSNHSQNG